MPKVAMIGAGSTVFATRLIGDMLTYPELADSTITLVDVDQKRLATTQAHAERAVQQLGAGMRIEAPATRREALEDADYVIVMVMIGGVAPFEVDIQVPARFGIDQTVGDTLGPGGVFRGLRTIPFLLELADEMEEVCPDALLLNYANPMAINCWAMNAATDIETIGLCHSVQGTARQLAGYCNIPADEVTYWVAGINHMAWFLRFEHQGE
ncbi:MAG: alpha-glucosidase/alpha-galactosidase, partial [Chloroflexi bacterium]|nr:alpha-glucosidase/alpha-galactosidase [Chloroflexota bacterium]